MFPDLTLTELAGVALIAFGVGWLIGWPLGKWAWANYGPSRVPVVDPDPDPPLPGPELDVHERLDHWRALREWLSRDADEVILQAMDEVILPAITQWENTP